MQLGNVYIGPNLYTSQNKFNEFNENGYKWLTQAFLTFRIQRHVYNLSDSCADSQAETGRKDNATASTICKFEHKLQCQVLLGPSESRNVPTE